MTAESGRRFYRLRAPGLTGADTAVSVRVDPDRPDPFPIYLAVGTGRRRMYLTADEAWVLWRCLSEAVASLGDPPDHIRTTIPHPEVVMPLLTQLLGRTRRPLRIQLTTGPHEAAAALRGLAYLVARRDDLDDQRIRIDLTIHTGSGR